MHLAMVFQSLLYSFVIDDDEICDMHTRFKTDDSFFFNIYNEYGKHSNKLSDLERA